LLTVCLSMYEYSIYYSQLSSFAILLQPEPNCFTWYNTMKGLCSLSLYAIVLRSPSPTCILLTVNKARSYLRPLYIQAPLQMIDSSSRYLVAELLLTPSVVNAPPLLTTFVRWPVHPVILQLDSFLTSTLDLFMLLPLYPL
jgi:hypothetical protein